MKRIIALLVLVATVLSLASCGVLYAIIPPNSPKVVLRRVNFKMSMLDSFKADVSGGMKFELAGEEVSTEISGVHIESGRNDIDDYYYYEKQELHMTSEDGKIDEQTETLTAYSDGKMYMENKAYDKDQRLFSPITVDEFMNSLFDMTDDAFEIEAEKEEFKENEDGTWTYIQSGHTKEDINSFAYNIGSFELFSNSKITDMVVTVVADEKFRAKSFLIEFVFEENNESAVKPEFYIKLDYSDYDCAERVTIDESGYTEVDNVLAIMAFNKKLNESYSDKDASVRISAVRDENDGSKPMETITILSYGENDDGYYYNIVQDNSILAYADGTVTVTQNNKSVELDQSEPEARVMVNSLLNVYAFELISVVDVVDLGDGRYNIVLQLDKQDYAAMSDGYVIKETEHTITVKFTDSGLEICECNIYIKTRNKEISLSVKIDYDWGESNGVNQA